MSAHRLPRILLLAVFSLPGCHHAGSAPISTGQATLKLTSSSFQGDRIPARFTCNGAGTSPQLAWNAPPAATASFALLVTDPDAPGRTFVHWVLFNLPAAARELPEGEPQSLDGARQGRNDSGNLGYAGPCPPGKSPHHYVFSLFALDTSLSLPQGASLAEVKAAMQGHILARGELIALYPM
jgi:Raf kinase inhibitor-like YbhB/YbcL family protein